MVTKQLVSTTFFSILLESVTPTIAKLRQLRLSLSAAADIGPIMSVFFLVLLVIGNLKY